MKIRAFTILEMVLVAFITTVVLGLGYNGYLMISKVSENKKQLQSQLSSVYRLHQFIQRETMASDSITWDEKKQIVSFSQSKLHLSELPVVLSSSLIDSINTELLDVNIVEVMSNNMPFVQEIKLKVLVDSVEVNLSAQKEYSMYFLEGL